MDPLGFALENFDTVGQFRVRDPDTGGAVDSAGVLPDGTRITGPDDLRRALIAHPEQFVQTVTEQLMSLCAGPPRGLPRHARGARHRAQRRARTTTDSPPSSARSWRPMRSAAGTPRSACTGDEDGDGVECRRHRHDAS